MNTMDIQAMKQAHKVLAKFTYEPGAIDRGYAGRTLYVNISDNTIASKPVTQQMKDVFVGGRGFGLKLLWDGISPDTKWDDPDNEIVISSGPLGGTIGYPGSGKSLVVSLSPLTGCVMDSNVGGHYGPLLKFAGWDAIEIQGKAEKDVIVLVDGDNCQVTIQEAPEEAVDSHVLGEQMAEMFADDDKGKRAVSSVSAGTGAEHALFGCLNFSWYDHRRKRMRYKQAGRGGIGTVLRDKKVKALVVKFSDIKGGLNNPADPEQLREIGRRVNDEMRRLDPIQNDMASIGTAHLVSIMNDYDLLPTHNFKYGAHPEARKISATVYRELYKPAGIPDGCWYGCTMACAKAIEGVTLRTGPYKGQVVGVDGPEYETIAGCGSNLGVFDPYWVAEFNFYCDTYGLDTISFGTAMAFVMECYEAGIINKEITGGLELNFRNAEAAAELLHQTARGEGFGLVFGQGIRRMKKIFAEEYSGDPQFLQDIGMESKGLEYSEYVTKESLAMQGGYGLTLKGPQHDEAWLIFMDQVNNQIPTFEDKAEALHYYPMWRTWFGLNGLCKIIWNDVTPEDNATTDDPAKIPAHVENFRQYHNAVTGRELSTEDIIVQSERVYNYQRVFNIRMGHGLRSNDAIPYRSAGPVTVEEYESRADRYDKQLRDIVGFDPQGKGTGEKMAALRTYREDQYEKLTDAVYARRGWTSDGVPTPEKLRELGIDFPEVVEVVKAHLS
jgi:aldehyde:ferredoxin oxidoreductase